MVHEMGGLDVARWEADLCTEQGRLRQTGGGHLLLTWFAFQIRAYVKIVKPDQSCLLA